MTDMRAGEYADPNDTPPLAQAVPLGLQRYALRGGARLLKVKQAVLYTGCRAQR